MLVLPVNVQGGVIVFEFTIAKRAGVDTGTDRSVPLVQINA